MFFKIKTLFTVSTSFCHPELDSGSILLNVDSGSEPGMTTWWNLLLCFLKSKILFFVVILNAVKNPAVAVNSTFRFSLSTFTDVDASLRSA